MLARDLVPLRACPGERSDRLLEPGTLLVDLPAGLLDPHRLLAEPCQILVEPTLLLHGRGESGGEAGEHPLLGGDHAADQVLVDVPPGPAVLLQAEGPPEDVEPLLAPQDEHLLHLLLRGVDRVPVDP